MFIKIIFFYVSLKNIILFFYFGLLRFMFFILDSFSSLFMPLLFMKLCTLSLFLRIFILILIISIIIIPSKCLGLLLLLLFFIVTFIRSYNDVFTHIHVNMLNLKNDIIFIINYSYYFDFDN